MGSGTYKGQLVDISDTNITIMESDGEEQSWRISRSVSRKKIERLQIDDEVEVEVEFNNYTVTDISVPSLESRNLRERLRLLEVEVRMLTQALRAADILLPLDKFPTDEEVEALTRRLTTTRPVDRDQTHSLRHALGEAAKTEPK